MSSDKEKDPSVPGDGPEGGQQDNNDDGYEAYKQAHGGGFSVPKSTFVDLHALNRQIEEADKDSSSEAKKESSLEADSQSPDGSSVDDLKQTTAEGVVKAERLYDFDVAIEKIGGKFEMSREEIEKLKLLFSYAGILLEDDSLMGAEAIELNEEFAKQCEQLRNSLDPQFREVLIDYFKKIEGMREEVLRILYDNELNTAIGEEIEGLVMVSEDLHKAVLGWYEELGKGVEIRDQLAAFESGMKDVRKSTLSTTEYREMIENTEPEMEVADDDEYAREKRAIQAIKARGYELKKDQAGATYLLELLEYKDLANSIKSDGEVDAMKMVLLSLVDSHLYNLSNGIARAPIGTLEMIAPESPYRVRLLKRGGDVDKSKPLQLYMALINTANRAMQIQTFVKALLDNS